MSRFIILSGATILMLFFASLAFAPTDPIPHMINYQGMLTDAGGIPLDGTYDLTFAIYSVSSGGSALWDETHNDVLVENGLFNVILGSTEAIPSSVFEAAERYLGIKVGTDAELEPRIRLTSVGYAYLAEKAITDNDWTISGNDIHSAVSGNVGIGAAPPAEKLDVAGTVKMTGFKMSTGASNGYVLTSDASGVGNWESLPAGGEIGGSGTAGYIPRFSTSTTIDNSVVYQSGTSIGIGITTPAEKLHVEGDIRIPASGDIAFGDDNTRIYESANDLMITAEDDVYLIPDDDVFIRKDGGSSWVRFANDEEIVGIGTITPATATRLHVYGGSSSWTKALIEGSSYGMVVLGDYNDDTNVKYFNLASNGEEFVIGTMSDGLGSFSPRLNILRNGNVGLGTSNPLERLHVNGEVYVATMYGTTSGSTVRWYNNRLYYYSSSEKYKDDIQPLEEDFDRILKAEPKSFVDKVSGEKNIGYIAEEFDQLGLNHLVTYRDGEPDALKYELVSVYLLELVKELKQKNQELERRIGELEAKE